MSVSHPPHAGPFLLHAPDGAARRVEVEEEHVDPCGDCGGVGEGEWVGGEPDERGVDRCGTCGGAGSYAYLWWFDPWTGTVFGTAPWMPGLGDVWRWEALLDEEHQHEDREPGDAP